MFITFIKVMSLSLTMTLGYALVFQ